MKKLKMWLIPARFLVGRIGNNRSHIKSPSFDFFSLRVAVFVFLAAVILGYNNIEGVDGIRKIFWRAKNSFVA